MKSLFPLEDVQLLEKAVAGLERSVEKDFQALPCNSLDYTRRDQGDVSFFRYTSIDMKDHEGTV